MYKYIYVCISKGAFEHGNPLSACLSTSHLLLLCQAAGSGPNLWEKNWGEKHFYMEQNPKFFHKKALNGKKKPKPKYNKIK